MNKVYMFPLKTISHHQALLQEYKWGFRVGFYFMFEISTFSSLYIHIYIYMYSVKV